MTTPYTRKNRVPGWQYSWSVESAKPLTYTEAMRLKLLLPVRPSTPPARLIWPAWLCACFAIGAAFAYYF